MYDILEMPMEVSDWGPGLRVPFGETQRKAVSGCPTWDAFPIRRLPNQDIGTHQILSIGL